MNISQTTCPHKLQCLRPWFFRSATFFFSLFSFSFLERALLVSLLPDNHSGHKIYNDNSNMTWQSDSFSFSLSLPADTQTHTQTIMSPIKKCNTKPPTFYTTPQVLKDTNPSHTTTEALLALYSTAWLSLLPPLLLHLSFVMLLSRGVEVAALG